jgi:hypothetical protein
MYVVANKGALPYGFWDGGDPPDPNKRTEWTLLLLNFLANKHGATYNDAAGRTGGVRELFRDKDTTDGTGITHYSAHPRLMPDLDDVDVAIAITGGGTVKLKPYKLAKVKRSAEVVLIMDGSQIRTLTGSPARIALCRAMLTPVAPSGLAQPISTSSTSAGSTPARATACWTAWPPSVAPWVMLKAPFQLLARGVRAVETMTASVMVSP